MGKSAVKINTKIITKDANTQLLALQNRIVKLAEKGDATTRKLEELGKVQIKTDEYKALEKELKAADKEAEKLHNKLTKLSDKSTYSEATQNAKADYMEMRNYADQIQQKMSQLVTDGTAFINPTTTKEYQKTKQDLDAINREMEIANIKYEQLSEKQKKVNNGFGIFLNKTTGLITRMAAFSLISRAFTAMTNTMKSGLQDMAQYSEEYNTNMSEFSSRTMELKYNLTAMAVPVLNILIPAFSTLVGWINTAVEAVTKFLSALSGKSTYTKAKKQVIDYAKSVKDAEKANKGALASFDELNVLEKNETADSSGGALSGADAFEEVEIDSDFVDRLDKVKELFMEILPYAIMIGIAIAGWKLLSFLGELLQVTSAFDFMVGALLLIVGLVISIIAYFDMWENGVDWEGIIYYISGIALVVFGLLILFGPVAAGIALIVEGIAGLILAIKDINENGLNAKNMTLLIISVIGILLGVMVAFGTKAMLIVAVIGLVIAIIASAIKWTENGEEALGHLKDAFGALGDFVSNIFAGDMEGAFKSLKEAGKSFGNFFISIAEGIANGFIKMVNTIIDAINSIEIDIPDWLEGITGLETWSPSLPNWNAHVEFTRLANGGITTGSTIAEIGEAGREAVLPLENNTGWMDDLAGKLAGKIGNNAGPIALTVNLDGKTVYKRMVQLDREFAGRTGHSQFSY